MEKGGERYAGRQSTQRKSGHGVSLRFSSASKTNKLYHMGTDCQVISCKCFVCWRLAFRSGHGATARYGFAGAGAGAAAGAGVVLKLTLGAWRDRKSTRLNSSLSQ